MKCKYSEIWLRRKSIPVELVHGLKQSLRDEKELLYRNGTRNAEDRLEGQFYLKSGSRAFVCELTELGKGGKRNINKFGQIEQSNENDFRQRSPATTPL